MSKYHKKCTEPPITPCKQKPAGKLKPFCDCEDCTSKTCPDVLQRLAITVNEKSCDFGSRGQGSAKPEKIKKIVPQRSSLLDFITSERECACEVMARAVRSHVHMNLGLSEQRKAKEPSKEPSCSSDNPKK